MLDIADQRLFVAELGNNSLDVIDLKSANASRVLVIIIIIIKYCSTNRNRCFLFQNQIEFLYQMDKMAQ